MTRILCFLDFIWCSVVCEIQSHQRYELSLWHIFWHPLQYAIPVCKCSFCGCDWRHKVWHGKASSKRSSCMWHGVLQEWIISEVVVHVIGLQDFHSVHSRWRGRHVRHASRIARVPFK